VLVGVEQFAGCIAGLVDMSPDDLRERVTGVLFE
jgi:hypothetical protein